MDEKPVAFYSDGLSIREYRSTACSSVYSLRTIDIHGYVFTTRTGIDDARHLLCSLIIDSIRTTNWFRCLSPEDNECFDLDLAQRTQTTSVIGFTQHGEIGHPGDRKRSVNDRKRCTNEAKRCSVTSCVDAQASTIH